MAAIFAIIAIIRQGIFAIVAIYLFANIANNSDMSNLDYENKRWLASRLDGVSRGRKGEIAALVGISATQLSRMANIDPKAGAKNTQTIPLSILRKFMGIWEGAPPPPGLSIEIPPPPDRSEFVRVPLIDSVTAGKLRQPLSQIEPGADSIPVADLGRGDFFALIVDGDSMNALVPNGARVIVDESDRGLVNGKPYVISFRGETSMKLWKPNPPRFAPWSFNPLHEPVYVKSKEAAEKMVVGRVKRAVVDL